MKRWSWKTWTMVGVLAALFVVAAVFVVVGVVTHEEAGFENPDVRWAAAPLSVSCAGFVRERIDDCGSVRAAVAAINRRLGFEMLRYDGVSEYRYVPGATPGITPDPTADISVLIGVPAMPDWMDPGGDATLRERAGRYVRCDVRTSNTGTSELLYLVIQHELGHCIGLAHDDYEQSIMRPVQRPIPGGEIGPWISDFDRELLRGRYGQ